ncbi:speckle-type POZ protein [Nephila pilipes]|uniref:Speckle-type POZ protein n=1 Tax=Nephila pilipes TaxID=299642 RepID=A0A8X6N8Z7_NEPPI|nr:speckle-type POZ protein [Nephila pilipes]
MASDPDDRKPDFTFFWMIENCPLLIRPIQIRSSSFHADSIRNTEWHLELFQPSNSKLCYSIHREESKGPDTIKIFFELSFLNDLGEPEYSESHEIYLGVLECFRYELVKDVFKKLRMSYLDNDALTVRCRMWDVESTLRDYNQCFSTLRMNTDRRTIFWLNKDFSRLLPGLEQVTYCLPHLLRVEHTMLKIILKVNKINDKEHILIQFSKGGSAEVPRFGFEISVIDISGRKNQSLRNTIELLETPQLANVIPMDTLTCDKDRLLPHDVLCLRCEFEFEITPHWNEFVAYVRDPDSD